jgi:hypothetical protein
MGRWSDIESRIVDGLCDYSLSQDQTQMFYEIPLARSLEEGFFSQAKEEISSLGRLDIIK